MNIVRYTSGLREPWDAFVRDSKNGTFLFERAYMEYHSDRFEDHSLLFYDDKGRLVSLFPANVSSSSANASGKTLYSHQGLTYGGFVLSERATMELVLLLFDSLLNYMRAQGFGTLIYKQIPSAYHRCPAEEDTYALWRQGAQMVGCNISCTVPLLSQMRPEEERRRRRGRAKAEELGYTVQTQAPLELFWPIMVRNLQERYNASPVHSLEEMQLLQSRFPRQIRCFLMRSHDGTPQAGAVVYETAQTVHVQYGHATQRGKNEGALDLLYLSLIEFYGQNPRFHYFDFGTSNEEGGRILNESLIAQKEGFGGRGIACPIWQITL